MAGESAERSVYENRPSAIDVHVGSRIRLRRILLGMTQDSLASALGLTFQQIQKYERGANRVGASRLFDISRVLGVPISYFFDDMPDGLSEIPVSGPRGRRYHLAERQEAFTGIDEQLTSREAMELVRAYYRITDPVIRGRMLDLIKSMASAKSQYKDA